MDTKPGNTLSKQITTTEFNQLRQLVYNKFGINLTEKKRTLLVGRLQKHIADGGFNSFSSYYNFVESDKSGEALSDLVDRVSTNHTYFNREPAHFTFFRDRALPELEASMKTKGSNDIRIWCAASSSGEEPYMLTFLMMEYFGATYKTLDAGLLATDISERALSKAKSGVYTETETKQIPKPLFKKYFKKTDDHPKTKEIQYEVIPDVRKEITYRRFNLMHDFPFKKKFDFIFMRNVMIYFDNKTRDELVSKAFHNLVAGGYLFIGHAETLGQGSPFEYVQPATYQKRI